MDKNELLMNIYKIHTTHLGISRIKRNLGIEDTYFTRTPNLTAPLRPNNIAKYDNYTILNSILDQT